MTPIGPVVEQANVTWVAYGWWTGLRTLTSGIRAQGLESGTMVWNPERFPWGHMGGGQVTNLRGHMG